MSNDARWHLDKRIPIALIVTIIIQSCTAVWWAAITTAQVDANQTAISGQARVSGELTTRLRVVENAASARSEALQYIRSEIEEVQSDLSENNRLLRELLRQSRRD